MVDPTQEEPDALLPANKDDLINQIDELENLLAQKKEEARRAALPRLKVGTDGIPILVETVTEGGLDSDKAQALSNLNKDAQVINNIMDKIDKEITEDLDELVLMLKDSIIDEVKIRLLKELHIDESGLDKNKNES